MYNDISTNVEDSVYISPFRNYILCILNFYEY
jgi:hypothetical protein